MNKKILITGSSSGIGAAITQQSLHYNRVVIGVARDHEKLNLATANYIPYKVDCADFVNLESHYKKIRNEHADIDSIISCCGYGVFKELEQFSWLEMQRIMQVNFLSQALLIKTFIPQFKARRSGRIIILGSECALQGQKKASLYCATKFALRGFAQSLRQECRQANIAVTIINPGMVDTPFFDRLAFRPDVADEFAIQPEQIAQMVETILQLPHNCVMEEINCQPMRNGIIKNGK